MKSYRKELTFHTKTRRAYVNITPQVEAALAESGVREGLCLVNAMHITASVFINDDESGLHRDFERWLEKLAPEKPYDQYDHNGYEDNADAHLKRSVMGPLPVEHVLREEAERGDVGVDRAVGNAPAVLEEYRVAAQFFPGHVLRDLLEGCPLRIQDMS